MTRIHPIDPTTATDETRRLLVGLREQFGTIPNSAAALANSHAALYSFLAFGDALARGALSPALRSLLSIAVSEANDCEYCVAANCAIGKSVGLSDNEISDSRQGTSTNSKIGAALSFARTIVTKRGWVTDDDVLRIRRAGYRDVEIVEIVAVVAWNLFINYFAHVAHLEVDFPEPPEMVLA